MAIKSFIPTFWADKVETAAREASIYYGTCNNEYEGKLQKAGDTVRILGIAKPTISKLERIDSDEEIASPEKVIDTSLNLTCNEIAYFNVEVGDFDEAQSNVKVMDDLRTECGLGLGEEVDKYIAGLAGAANAKLHSKTAEAITKDNVLKVIRKGIEELKNNHVKVGYKAQKVDLFIPPWVGTLYKEAHEGISTDNVKMLEDGDIGYFEGVHIKETTNVLEKNGEFKLMMKTQKAISAVQKVGKVVAYEPEKKFSDAIKGYVIYGAKITRPKEMVVLNVKQSA